MLSANYCMSLQMDKDVKVNCFSVPGVHNERQFDQNFCIFIIYVGASLRILVSGQH